LDWFHVVIDLNTPSHVLKSFTQSLNLDEAACFDEMWPQLLEAIECVRWAYVPLSDEADLAVFVARPTDACWVAKLKRVFDVQGVPYARIVREAGRERWRLPYRLRQLCLPPFARHGDELREPEVPCNDDSDPDGATDDTD